MVTLVQPCAKTPCPALRAEKAKLERLKTDGAASAAAYQPAGHRTPPPGHHEATDDELADMNLKRSMLGNLRNGKGEVTGFNAAVFVNNKTGERIVAFKGTDPDATGDVSNDVRQQFGMRSDYYVQANKIATKVAGSDMAGGTHFTGHSLGGGLAASAAKRGGMKATTFNAATVNTSTVPDPNSAARIEPVSVRGDPLTRANEGVLGTTADTDPPYKIDPPDDLAQKVASDTPWWNLKAKATAYGARQKALHGIDTANVALAKREKQVDAEMKANRC